VNVTAAGNTTLATPTVTTTENMGVFSMMRQFQMLPFRTENDYGFLPLSHIAPDHLQDQAESGDVSLPFLFPFWL